MSETSTATRTVADLAPALAFLMEHPHLPVVHGVTIYRPGEGNDGISVVLDTAEQVQAWADAMGVAAESGEHEGTIQHTAHARTPLSISVRAIVPAIAEVSA